jgi:NTE family protein
MNHIKTHLFRTVLFAALCFCFVPASAHNTERMLDSAIREETLPSPTKPRGRPSVALILDGGGARGFAHIPVIELLEQEHIPIDMVVGTSAGSIVGGLYCAGYTPAEIRDNLFELSSSGVLKNSTYSPFEQILGGHSTYSTPLSVTFGSRDQSFSLGMGNGMLTGQNVYEMFKKLTIKIPSDTDFDTLHIPFRAVATNLIEGTVAVFSQGDVAEAIRSSMSIPGLFQPFEINGNYFIDGLALDNEPIDVAVKMGYDIIIVSAFSDGMEDKADSFDANPLVAVSQMMNMDQSARIKTNRKCADLIISPDYGGENLVAYAQAEKIYNASKKSMESYRASCKELYKKIYGTSYDEQVPAEQTAEQNSVYDQMQNLVVTKLTVSNAEPGDETFIRQQFDKIAGKPLTKDRYMTLARTIFHIGKYRTVKARIIGDTSERTLELILQPEKKENGLVLLGASLYANAAMDSSFAFSLSTDLQWRGLTGYGSVISAKTSFLNGFDTEFLFRQPLGSFVFSQLTVDYTNDTYKSESGWSYYPVRLVSTQGAYANLKFGISFADTAMVFSSDAGFRWLKTDEDLSYGVNDCAGDFSTEYTLNTLDYPCFPTKGVYVSVKGTGVLPLSEHSSAAIFDVEHVDATGAIPFGHSVNLILNGYVGMSLSERMKYVQGYYPVYAFSLADRQFFPQVSTVEPWGLHKIAIGGALQYEPGSDISVFGINMLVSISGAVGNVWADYSSMTMSGLSWYASANAGLRLQNAFGILLRIGAGTSRDTVCPFVSVDVGNIRL